jgi:HEPN domain-containing protein/predicted nucleotidyltransferase
MIDTRLGEDQVLEHVTQTIVEHLRPRRIVLFGSRARGDAKTDSDYDIMVEMETDLGSTERRRAVNDLFRRGPRGMDILVYTPDEVRRWKDDVGMVLYDIVREGRVLYCRPDVADGETGSAVSTPAPPRVSEPRPGPPESLASWMRRAQHDFDAMEGMAKWDSAPWDVICFHAHQAAEKLLKACLIARSIQPPRTHDLCGLLDLCVHTGLDLERLRGACETLNDLWPRARYPEDGEPTSSEAARAIAAATAVRDAVLPLLDSSV